MRILGIDPGTSRIGFGVIDTKPRLSLVAYDTLKTRGLLDVAQQFNKLLQQFKPDAVGIESIYFSSNQKTGIQVAQARGVLLLKALECGLPVTELGPMQVKQAVTNYGRADKKAVAKMVQTILGVTALKGFDDASDALAIAIAAANYTKFGS